MALARVDQISKISTNVYNLPIFAITFVVVFLLIINSSHKVLLSLTPYRNEVNFTSIERNYESIGGPATYFQQ